MGTWAVVVNNNIDAYIYIDVTSKSGCYEGTSYFEGNQLYDLA